MLRVRRWVAVRADIGAVRRWRRAVEMLHRGAVEVVDRRTLEALHRGAVETSNRRTLEAVHGRALETGDRRAMEAMHSRALETLYRRAMVRRGGAERSWTNSANHALRASGRQHLSLIHI